MKCDFCGRDLEAGVPYKIEGHGGFYNSFHLDCLALFNAYLLMRNQHAAWCHAENCTKGPTNPFAKMKAEAAV